MEDKGILKLTGVITDFSIWDDTIHIFAVKFHGQPIEKPDKQENVFTYRKIA